MSGQFQFGFHPRDFVVNIEDEFYFRMYNRIANDLYQPTRCPSGGMGLIIRFPFLEPALGFGVQPRPAIRLPGDSATPGLWRESRAKTFLSLAELAIKRISPQRIKHFLCNRCFRLDHVVRGEQSQPGPSAINPPAPAGMRAYPGFHFSNGSNLRSVGRPDFWSAKEPFPKTSSGFGVVANQCPQT